MRSLAGVPLDDVRLARTLRYLGSVQYDLARYADAEVSLKRSLAIAEKQLPSDAPELGIVLGNLGNLYGNQGR